MRFLGTLTTAGLLIALSTGVTPVQAGPKNAGASGAPPHASTTGMGNRSETANRHGANRRGFCPPGQAKKPGKGSAFKC